MRRTVGVSTRIAPTPRRERLGDWPGITPCWPSHAGNETYDASSSKTESDGVTIEQRKVRAMGRLV